MTIRVDVKHNFRSVRMALRALPGEVEEKMHQRGLVAAGKVIAARAGESNRYFRDRTRRLRGSIKVRTADENVGRRRKLFARVEMGGAGARQAVLIELGTERMKARAPLARAVNDTLELQRMAARSEMERGLLRIAREFRTGRISRRTRRELAA